MEKNVPGKSNVTTEHLAASQNVSYIVSNKDDIDGGIEQWNTLHWPSHYSVDLA